MSGHNKWSQIKHRKGAADAARSNVWGKLAKRIAVESRNSKWGRYLADAYVR